MRQRAGLAVTVLCFGLSAGCSLIPGIGKPKVAEAPPQPSQEPRQATAARAAQTADAGHEADAIPALIEESERHYAAGERELQAGHLERARQRFDLALRVITESPWGARSDERLSDHFDRLVDRISAQESIALATGDGFTEKPSEPALIDKVLEITTFNPPLPPQPGFHEAVERALAARRYDFPIPLHDRVLEYVQLFQTRLSSFIVGSLARGGRYLPMINEVFAAEGLPLDLAYIPVVESAFKPTALSRASARGVWQFMQRTAAEQGLETDWFVDERADPEKSTRAAASYLKVLRDMFEGDWLLALASYNGGPGRVQRAIQRAGTDDFWQLSSTSQYLPRETREYVPMVLAAMIIARNPEQYGLEIEPEPPLAYEAVPVRGVVDLRRVAEWAGASIDEVQALNPELRRWTTPLRNPGYEVKVPVGTGDQLRARLARTTEEELAALQWYIVRRGDTLSGVAQKLGVRRVDLAAANGISAQAYLQIGQELLVPRAPASTLLASRAGSASAAGTTSANRREPADAGPLTYRVQRGDSLYTIARAHGVSIAQLREWNGIRGSRLHPGDRLTIFVAGGTRAAQ